MGEATAGRDGAEFLKRLNVRVCLLQIFNLKKENIEIGNNRGDTDRAKAEKLSNFYQFWGMHPFSSLLRQYKQLFFESCNH